MTKIPIAQGEYSETLASLKEEWQREERERILATLREAQWFQAANVVEAKYSHAD